MNPTAKTDFGKVPEVTLIVWIIKVAATTFGETAGDAVTMSIASGVFGRHRPFCHHRPDRRRRSAFCEGSHPFLFWVVIVATTTAGTTLADFFDRHASPTRAHTPEP